jgi:hypothetical protein
MSTYVPIASIVSSSNASSITFVGVPQFYTDLILNISAKHSSTVENHRLRFNDDTSANYADLRIFGNGTSTFTDSRENATSILLGEISASQFGADKWFIPQYTNTSFQKRIIGRSGNIGGNAQVGTGEYRSYSAITSITILAGSGNFVDGSTFNLYGIASGSAKAIGGTVTTDGTYFYHTFYSSNVFTPLQDLTVDYLVIAGGGAGGGNTYARGTGGGGAGGFRTSIGGTALSLTAQNYAVTVGAGGPANRNIAYGGSSSQWGPGGNGSNSVFATISSTGGGGGGNGSGTPALGLSGGSGGGNAEFSNSVGGAGNAGGYSPVEGYAGGTTTADYGATGGGGAGGAGVNRTTNSGTNGGIGRQLTALATPTGTGVSSGYYAGGGGGGADFDSGNRGAGSGGTGGGGNGATDSANAGAGTINTGSGGGGGSGNGGSGYASGSGGSGIVIVRYAV